MNADIRRDREAILDYAFKVYEQQVDTFDKLDDKSATLAGFTGVIITLVSGFIVKIFSTLTHQKDIALINFLIFFSLSLLLVFSLAISFICSLMSIKIRQIDEPPGIQNIISSYRQLSRDERSRGRHIVRVVKALSKAESSFRKNNKSKADYLEITTRFLIISIILGVLLFLYYLVYSML